MKPMQPDEINEILEQPSTDLGISEEKEREVRGTFKALADEMGAEKFMDFTMQFLLGMEDYLREVMDPNSDSIQMLNEYHRVHG